MIQELINQSNRNLQQGVDILEQISTCREIKGSISSIFEVQLKSTHAFQLSKLDEEFFEEEKYNNALHFSEGNQLYILKEVIGTHLQEEVNIVKSIRSRERRIIGLVYLINYAVYKTDALEVGYILMERGDMNLQQFIDSRISEGNPINQSEFLTILSQTVSALSQMQLEKIAHNDIKPANILVFKKKKKNLVSKSPKILEQLKMIKQENSLSVKTLLLSPNHMKSASSENGGLSPLKYGKENAMNNIRKSARSSNRIKLVIEDRERSSNHVNEEIESPLESPILIGNTIDYDIIVKLCDIGSGQTNQSTEKMGEQRGTFQYMAPEILTKTTDRINIYKQDVFSLGLCLVYLVLQKTSNYFQMIRAPWKDILSTEQSIGILEDVLSEWIRIIGIRMQSKEIEKILLSMLCIDRKNRPDFIQLAKMQEDIFEPPQIFDDISLSSPSQPDSTYSQESNTPNNAALHLGNQIPNTQQNVKIEICNHNKNDIISLNDMSPSDQIENGDTLNQLGIQQIQNTAQKVGQVNPKLVSLKPHISSAINKIEKPPNIIIKTFESNNTYSSLSPQVNSASFTQTSINGSHRKYLYPSKNKDNLQGKYQEISESALLATDFRSSLIKTIPSAEFRIGQLGQVSVLEKKIQMQHNNIIDINNSQLEQNNKTNYIFPPKQITNVTSSHSKQDRIKSGDIQSIYKEFQYKSEGTIDYLETATQRQLRQNNILDTQNDSPSSFSQVNFQHYTSPKAHVNINYFQSPLKGNNHIFSGQVDKTVLTDTPKKRSFDQSKKRQNFSSPTIKLPSIHIAQQAELALSAIPIQYAPKFIDYPKENEQIKKDQIKLMLHTNLNPIIIQTSSHTRTDSSEISNSTPSSNKRSSQKNESTPSQKASGVNPSQTKSQFFIKSKGKPSISASQSNGQKQTHIQKNSSQPIFKIHVTQTKSSSTSGGLSNSGSSTQQSNQISNFLRSGGLTNQSPNSLQASFIKSTRSLSEPINDNFECVCISDFTEMSKFYDNFIQISQKNLKFLTISLSTQDKTQNYGIIDLLSKLEGLINLSIMIVQQKRDVIQWILDALQIIGPSLQNLQLIFKDCDFSVQSISENQNDFVFSLDSLNNQAQLKKNIAIIIQFEGKNINSSQIFEYFTQRSSSFHKRVNLLSIDLKKNLDDLSRFVKLLVSFHKETQCQQLELDLSQNCLSQNDSNALFSSFDSFNLIHSLSLNLSLNNKLFNNSSSISLPIALQDLHLNLSNATLSSVELVKLTKAIKQCQKLSTIHLHISNCLQRNESNQFMLFLQDLFKQVENVNVFADSNFISDSDFQIYKSDFLESFKIENLMISLAKNTLTLSSFQNNKRLKNLLYKTVLSQMISMQKSLKKALIIFPRTFRKNQIEKQFPPFEGKEFALIIKNDDYDTLTVQVDIQRKFNKKLSLIIDKRVGELLSSKYCWNFEKKSIFFPGFFCLTCYETFSEIQSDSYFCQNCINSCHPSHQFIPITKFSTAHFICRCKQRPQQCENYHKLQQLSETLSPIKLSSPSKW